MDDLSAIVEEGGITTVEFPPLERDFDYVINHFLPIPMTVLIGETVFDVETSASTSTSIVLALENSVDVLSSSFVAVALDMQSNTNVEVLSESEAVSQFLLSHETIFAIDNASTTTSEFLLSHDSNWSIENDSAVTVELVLAHASSWEVSSVASLASVSAISHDTIFEVESAIYLKVDLTLDHDTTWGIQHRAAIRGEDRVENLPVWSFEPNWKDDNLETLEWLTDIMRSPTGAEQRRALRLFPRRTFEFNIALKGGERSYFDNMIITHGARDWYLPLWHDAHYLEADLAAESAYLPCSTAEGTFRVGDIVFVGEIGSARKFELGEVLDLSETGINLVEPLTYEWETGARIHLVKKARLTEQPRPRRESDDTISSQIRFRIIERNDEIEPGIDGDLYRTFNVISSPPDEAEALEYGFERILEELDNQVGIPSMYDSAGISFPSQRHSWTLKGRAEHASFMSLVHQLRGKARPVWLPTFFNDFDMALDAPPGATSLTVEEVGFTSLGGPKESRRDIMIELLDGTRLYRRIVASTIVDGREVLGLDSAFPAGLLARNVMRISFMALSRLDQDAIELSHKTDIDGVSTVVTTFRNAPDIRQANLGF